MGVSTNIYTFYGIKIEWNDDFHEAYDEVYADIQVPVIVDAMMGEYIVFGEQLFDSGDFRYGMEDGQTYTETDLEALPELREKYIEEFCKWLPEFRHLIDVEWKIICFTHYS